MAILAGLEGGETGQRVCAGHRPYGQSNDEGGKG